VDLDVNLPRSSGHHVLRQQRSPDVVGELANIIREPPRRDDSMRASNAYEGLRRIELNLRFNTLPEYRQHRRTFGAEELVLVAADGLVDLIC